MSFGAIGMVADEAFAFVAVAIGEFASRSGELGVERFFRGFPAARAYAVAAERLAAPALLCRAFTLAAPPSLFESGTGIVTNPSRTEANAWFSLPLYGKKYKPMHPFQIAFMIYQE